MPSYCCVCTGNLSADHEQLNCRVCKQSGHLACVNKCPSFDANKPENFICNACDPKNCAPLNTGHFLTLLQQFNSIKLDTQARFSNIASDIVEIKTNLTAINDTLSQQTAKIESCTADITSLQSENSILKSRISDLENKIEEIPRSFHSEVIDRLERSKNVIIKGLAECNDTELTHCIKNIIVYALKYSPSDSLPIFNGFRIGKISQERPRMTKVIFKSSEIALSVLRGNKNLANTDYANVKISADRSKQQREHLSKLYNTLEQRKASGEKNLSIRTINGEPQIVKQRNKRIRSEEDSPARDPGIKTMKKNVTPKI